MKQLVITLLFPLLLASCGHGKSNTVTPSRLLSEQEMVSLLTDMQIIEADLSFRKTNQEDLTGLPQRYYGQLYEHYGITDSIFAENLRFYTEQPAVAERIMDSVSQRLTKVQSESRRDDSQ